MELLEGEGLRRRMLEGYSRNPKGWSFTVSPSLGSQAEADARLEPGNPFPYCYRRLPPEVVLQLLGGDRPTPKKETLANIASVLRSEPIVPEAGRSYAEGPFFLTSPGKVSLSESQKQIDARLVSEMHRVLKMRYPAYG